MKGRQSIRRQAMVITLGNGLVRGIGFFLRMMISRLLGPEAMGLMELAGSAHSLAITPAASGLPGAVSRLTARAGEEDRPLILLAGRQLALGTGGVLMILYLLLSPWIGWLLGEEGVLPALWLGAPSILLIGLSSVYDGAFFGRGSPWPPTISELSEQVIRLSLSLPLLMGLQGLTAPWRAAIPALAGTAGEGIGLVVVAVWMGRIRSGASCMEKLPAVRRELASLSLPLMLNRLSHTALRALSSAMIPQRLMAAGLPRGEALSRMGMLSGMVFPLLFLPGLFTGALSTAGGPAMARCRSHRAQRRLMGRLMLPALGVGLGAAGLLYLSAPLIAYHFYRLPELAPLLRAMCPMAVLLSLQQAAGGMMTGLGLQKKALFASLLGAAAQLFCTWLWTANPSLHIFGAGHAHLVGHGLGLAATLIPLLLHVFQQDPA